MRSVLFLILLVVDHLTELPVVQLVISTRVKLSECCSHLLICQVLADCHELLKQEEKLFKMTK